MHTVKLSKSSHPETRRIEVMTRRKFRKHNWFIKEAGAFWATPSPQRHAVYAHVALWLSNGEKLPARWDIPDAMKGREYAQLYAFRRFIKVLQTNEKRRFKLTW